MSRIKEWWLSISRKWRLVIISLSAIVVLGVGGVYGSLAYFEANPSACGACHLMDSYVESYYESDFLDNAHAQAEDPVKCKDCHVVTLDQIVKEGRAFVTGDYELPLETRFFYEQEFCLKCHSFEDVQKTTKDDWQDRGLQFDPHDSPHLTAESGVWEGGYVECQWCHRGHDESQGILSCTTVCHHTDGEPKKCDRCHAGEAGGVEGAE
jgi:hypothetical protein